MMSLILGTHDSQSSLSDGGSKPSTPNLSAERKAFVLPTSVSRFPMSANLETIRVGLKLDFTRKCTQIKTSEAFCMINFALSQTSCGM